MIGARDQCADGGVARGGPEYTGAECTGADVFASAGSASCAAAVLSLGRRPGTGRPRPGRSLAAALRGAGALGGATTGVGAAHLPGYAAVYAAPCPRRRHHRSQHR